jgi:peroxiredoxin
MKKLIQIISVGLCLAFASTLTAVSVGETAPDFTLEKLGGSEVSLSSLRGQYVVLEWTNPGCPFVKKFYEAGAMQAFQKEAEAMGVTWVSINSTPPDHRQYIDPAATESYYEEKGVESIWLFDSDGTVGKSYSARTTPHCFVINPEGVIVYAGAIDDQKSTDPSSLEGANNYVMAALKSSMKGEPIAEERTRPYGCSIKY